MRHQSQGSYHSHSQSEGGKCVTHDRYIGVVNQLLSPGSVQYWHAFAVISSLGNLTRGAFSYADGMIWQCGEQHKVVIRRLVTVLHFNQE